MEDENEQEEQEVVPDVSSVEQSYSDEQQDLGEYQQEMQEEQQFGSYPNAIPRESIFTFFRHILGIKDSSKVANLDKRELGMLDLSVRNSEHLAKLGYMLHNKSYGDWFMGKAEITLATSMSKKGWLSELVVSQKKFSQRTVQPMNLQPAKKGFLGFGGSKPETPQQQLQ
jgi:hypothetical protein